MPRAKCGCFSTTTLSGTQALTQIGPTLFVTIGFDPSYSPAIPGQVPQHQTRDLQALVDTGAMASCIDSALAAQLGLPIINQVKVSGVGGPQLVNVHLAQIHVPSLNFTIWGPFAGVHLTAGGQPHLALLGRDFLQQFTMIYDGTTGDVTLLY